MIIYETVKAGNDVIWIDKASMRELELGVILVANGVDIRYREKHPEKLGAENAEYLREALHGINEILRRIGNAT